MPFCPMCKENIDYLECWSTLMRKHRVTLGEGNIAIYGDTEDEVASDDADDYACPECNVPLFWKESEAIDFLKGGE